MGIKGIPVDGDLLRRTREDRIGPREALAYKAGVSTSTVALIELGERSPSPDVLDRICRALRINPEQIMVADEGVAV